jgi:large subunit ribosomal protein L14
MGSMHRALVVRSKVNYCRFPGSFIKFDENAVILVTRRIIPISSRAVGPLLKEFCLKWPSFGCISRCLV